MIVDKAREVTDKKLAEMEKRIENIYKEAQADITKKWNKYMASASTRISALEAKYAEALKGEDKLAADKAKEMLEKAKINATLTDNRYKAMIDDTTKRLASVNNIALSYVNGEMPSIYAVNYNQVLGEAKEFGVRFDIVDENTVKQLVMQEEITLPKKKVEIPKDMQWNRKQLNSSVLQGILQGESMNKIANRIFPIMDNNKTAAIRNARTMVTGAENQGRLNSYKDLQSRGAIMKKVWIATNDDRTREWHLNIDGQEVDVDDPFVDGRGNELDYPGDPSAEPETVYNCRCSMRTHIIGVDKVQAEEDAEDAKEENVTPDIDGPMKDVPKIEEEATAENVAKSVNPNFGEGREYDSNCANCVVASEARYRGYDVIAKERDFSRNSNIYRFYYDNRQGAGSWTDSFKDMVGETINASRKTQIAEKISQKMNDYGEGSRAVIFVKWDGKSVGHYFNVSNEGGEIVFFDSQNGKTGDYVKDYFMSASPSQTRIWRTDDKEMTDFIRQVVKPNE